MRISASHFDFASPLKAGNYADDGAVCSHAAPRFSFSAKPPLFESAAVYSPSPRHRGRRLFLEAEPRAIAPATVLSFSRYFAAYVFRYRRQELEEAAAAGAPARLHFIELIIGLQSHDAELREAPLTSIKLASRVTIILIFSVSARLH